MPFLGVRRKPELLIITGPSSEIREYHYLRTRKTNKRVYTAISTCAVRSFLDFASSKFLLLSDSMLTAFSVAVLFWTSRSWLYGLAGVGYRFVRERYRFVSPFCERKRDGPFCERIARAVLWEKFFSHKTVLPFCKHFFRTSHKTVPDSPINRDQWDSSVKFKWNLNPPLKIKT